MWDIVSGKVITRLANHQKTVTKICFEGSGTWFASSSLDHQVKVYDLSNYQVVNSFKYTAPILTFAISVRFYNFLIFYYFNLLIPSLPCPLSSLLCSLSPVLSPPFPLFPFLQKNNSHLVTGMSDGTLSIRRRRAEKEDGKEEETPRTRSANWDDDEPAEKGQTFRQYLFRGASAKPTEVNSFPFPFQTKLLLTIDKGRLPSGWTFSSEVHGIRKTFT